MIPEAAVEAAARAMFAEEQCDRRQKLDVEVNWRGRLDDRDRDEYKRLTRPALEAAAPHLMAPPVTDEAFGYAVSAIRGHAEMTTAEAEAAVGDVLNALGLA